MPKNQTIGAVGIPSSEAFGNATVTNTDVINALETIKEIPKQIVREMKEVIRDVDISSVQDLIDIDWGTLIEYAEILIKFLGG